MSNDTCSVGDCERESLKRGLCSMHYQRVRKTGSSDLAPKVQKKCSVSGCTNQYKAKGYCGSHLAKLTRHGDPMITKNVSPRTPIEERLLFALPDRPEDGCWEWARGRNKAGYGMVSVPGTSIGRLASRCAHEVWVGPIPPGIHVLHTCDNPPCCNPKHLFLGDDLDNSNDKLAKKRNHNGERTYGHKLTDEQVTAIRAAYTGVRGHQTRLAEQYGVRPGQISLIVRGLSRREPTHWEAVDNDERLRASYPERVVE